jgi:hypothetical protein
MLIRQRRTSCCSFLFLWCVRLPFDKVSKVRNRGICWFAVTFSLERKSNQKVQGKPDRSARFSMLARGKSL